MRMANEQLQQIIVIENADGTTTKMTVAEAIVDKQIKLALAGDIKSAEYVRDISGNKPKNELNIESKMTLVDGLKLIAGEDEF